MRVENWATVQNVWQDWLFEYAKTGYSTLEKNLVIGIKNFEFFLAAEKLDGSIYRKYS